MRWLRRKTTWLAGPAGMLFAVALLAWTGRGDPLREEYPDAPFARVGDDFPRIISVTEAPSRQDEKAYAEYQKERQKVREFLLEKGAMIHIILLYAVDDMRTWPAVNTEDPGWQKDMEWMEERGSRREEGGEHHH